MMSGDPSGTLLKIPPLAGVVTSPATEPHPRFILQGTTCVILPEDQLKPDLQRIGQIKLGSERFIVAAVKSMAQDRPCLQRLTRREREIAWLVAEGLFTKQIAYRLGVSPHTVIAYMNRIFMRLSVHTRAEMVAVMLTQVK